MERIIGTVLSKLQETMAELKGRKKAIMDLDEKLDTVPRIVDENFGKMQDKQIHK